jgi:hypothetical protein
MKNTSCKLTLYQPATYQIKVPGIPDKHWSEWLGDITIVVEDKGENPPVTILTGTLDQAALHGLLRRLYSMCIPLISVICVSLD